MITNQNNKQTHNSNKGSTHMW